MRLICPNCGAQYEVSDDAIPPGGREVQCSSCAQTWFQTDKPVVAEEAATEDAADTAVATEETATEEPAAAAPARKPLDNAVANILREEAARGDNLPRGGNVAPPPTQAPPRPAEVIDANKTRERIAQMTVAEGGTTAGNGPAAAAAAQAANLRSVPTINEITAALRARAAASDPSGLNEREKLEEKERRGFRGGFFGVLAFMIAALGPYFFADEITQNLPQTTDAMSNYVAMVDGLRDWVNAQVDTVRGMVGGGDTSNG
ncbi:MAG: zinc-ribbon domain-containing protein [Pseudomonadota bacterium]